MQDSNNKRFLLLVVLPLAMITVAVFACFAFANGPPGGHAAPPQPDTLIYQQYARSIAEGHPYQFNVGDAPSTGSTSHLYPWILAAFYTLGAQGHALASAGFWLNAVCYLLFLIFFYDAARIISPKAATLATILCLTSGQTAYTAMGQSDMGVFMALSMAAFSMLLRQRHLVCGALLFLCSLQRPEGFIISAMLVLIAVAGLRTDRKTAFGRFFAGACGLVGWVFVLLLNKELTGSAAFQSVIGKGYLVAFSPVEAIFLVCRDLSEMLQEVCFGLDSEGRQFYLLPIVGGLLALFGLASRDWENGATARVEFCWLGAGLAAAILVAQSGWQGVQYDRYAGWILPLGYLYCAIGLHQFLQGESKKRMLGFLSVMLVLYQMLGMAFFTSTYARNCAALMPEILFVEELNETLPPGSRIGMHAYSGLGAYYMPRHSVQNINGITSSVFSHPEEPLCNIELFKHRPELRTDYWLFFPGTKREHWTGLFAGEMLKQGNAIPGGDSPLSLYPTDWSLLNGSEVPLEESITSVINNLELVDQLDVGYLADETRSAYRRLSSQAGNLARPFEKVAPCADKRIVDVGRIVLGQEQFEIKVRENQALWVVMRIARTTLSDIPRETKEETDFVRPALVLPAESVLQFEVSGKNVESISLELNTQKDIFQEIIFKIPASFVENNQLRIQITGSYLSFGYWFYQE